MQYYVVFLFFEYCLSSGGIFPVLFVGGFSCGYPFITLVSISVYFGRAGFLGVSLAGRVIFSFVWGSALWSVGPVLFIWVLAGLGGGAVRVFLFFGSVEAGTVRLK